MNENQAEAYQTLWNKAPPCLSEADIFENKNAAFNSKAFLFEDPNLQRRSLLLSVHKSISGSVNLDLSKPETIKEIDGNMRKFETLPDSASKKNKYNYEIDGEKIVLARISCFVFPDNFCLRRAIVHIVLWKYTDLIITLITLINAIVLGIYDYTQPKYAHTRNTVVFFLVEKI